MVYDWSVVLQDQVRPDLTQQAPDHDLGLLQAPMEACAAPEMHQSDTAFNMPQASTEASPAATSQQPSACNTKHPDADQSSVAPETLPTHGEPLPQSANRINYSCCTSMPRLVGPGIVEPSACTFDQSMIMQQYLTKALLLCGRPATRHRYSRSSCKSAGTPSNA